MRIEFTKEDHEMATPNNPVKSLTPEQMADLERIKAIARDQEREKDKNAKPSDLKAAEPEIQIEKKVFYVNHAGHVEPAEILHNHGNGLLDLKIFGRHKNDVYVRNEVPLGITKKQRESYFKQ